VPSIPPQRPARKAVDGHLQNIPSLQDTKAQVQSMQTVTPFVFDPIITDSSHRDLQKLTREGKESSPQRTPRPGPAFGPLQASERSQSIGEFWATDARHAFQISGFAAGLRTPDAQALDSSDGRRDPSSFSTILLGHNPSRPRLRSGFQYAQHRPLTSGSSTRIHRPISPTARTESSLHKSPGLRSPGRPQSARQPYGPIALGIGVGSDADCIVLSSPRLRSQEVHSQASSKQAGGSDSPLRMSQGTSPVNQDAQDPMQTRPIELADIPDLARLGSHRPTTASAARPAQSPQSSTPIRPATAGNMPTARQASDTIRNLEADITWNALLPTAQHLDTPRCVAPELLHRRFIPLTKRRLDSAGRSGGRRNDSNTTIGTVNHHQAFLSMYLGAIPKEGGGSRVEQGSGLVLPSPRADIPHRQHNGTSPRSRPVSARQGRTSARSEHALSNLTTVAEVGVLTTPDVRRQAASTPRSLLLRDGEDIKRRQEPMPQAASNVPVQMMVAVAKQRQALQPVLSSDHVLVGQGTVAPLTAASPDFAMSLGAGQHVDVSLEEPGTGIYIYSDDGPRAAATNCPKLNAGRQQRPVTAIVTPRQRIEEASMTTTRAKHNAAAAALHAIHRSPSGQQLSNSFGVPWRTHSAESGPSAWHVSPTGTPLKSVVAQAVPTEPVKNSYHLEEARKAPSGKVLPERPARGMSTIAACSPYLWWLPVEHDKTFHCMAAKARKKSFSRSLLHIDGQAPAFNNHIHGIAGSGTVIPCTEDMVGLAVLGLASFQLGPCVSAYTIDSDLTCDARAGIARSPGLSRSASPPHRRSPRESSLESVGGLIPNQSKSTPTILPFGEEDR